ncbi:MAG TPA: hypothetical protein VGB64_06655 [Actinomycetota bacterium]
MKKILALLMLVLAIGAAPMISSADECTDVEGNRACTTDTGVALDGDADNPDPLDGFITVDLENGGGCASDDGDYDDPEQGRTCL